MGENMENFKKAFNGYDKKQVNEYLCTLDLKSKSNENTLKEKISLLEEELLSYKREIANYKRKEESLANALVKITEFEESVKSQAQKQMDIECERAEIFKKKWEEYSFELLGVDPSEGVQKMDKIITDYNESVRDCLENNLKLKKEDKEEKHIPTDAEKLSGLCRKLGILED